MPVDPNEIFPLVEFHGRTARERGHEHGSLLADRITRSIAFYQEQFAKQPRYSETFVLNLCEQYRRGIAAFSSEYLEELDSIAIASQQDPLSIVMLNCRLELLSHLTADVQNECTVLYDARTCELGENWDWAECFEQLAFVNRLTHNQILQINEPGVLGKIGFNAHGIGVTLNFVDPRYQSKTPSNVPLHILLRTVLDRAETLEQAINIFEEHGPGFGGHTLVGEYV
jgi:isopenicillin-N N-acyltransferase-like protein